MTTAVAAHPRLSVNALSSVTWSFEQDFALWRELGLSWVGLMSAKLGERPEAPIKRLADAGMRVSTVVARRFDLNAPATWEATRAELDHLVDVVAEFGGWSVYLTPGQSTGAPWDEVLDTFAQALGPSVERTRSRGVRLAIEPSKRVDVSFVNTLPDAIEVAERVGVQIVADTCHIWPERNLESDLLRAAPHLGLVQISDVHLGAVKRPDEPAPIERVVPGDGMLPLPRLLSQLQATGYTGPVELEMIGRIVEEQGYESTIRRGVEATVDLLEQGGW